MENIFDWSVILSLVGVLVVITNIIVQVLKKLTWDKLPTNILAVLIAMALTLAAFFAYCEIKGVAIVWYMIVAAVVLGFFVAYAAMFGFDKLKEKVVNPLTGKKIGAYYGCLLLRPGKIMAFDDPENPTIMEDFIRALGAEPVIYPYRNECCGGYISLKEKDMSQNMCQKIEDSAKGFGADMLITACPLCKYNLNKNASSELPVYYFTELLAEALGVKEEVAK